MIFTFEMGKNGCSLHVGFDHLKDPEVLGRINAIQLLLRRCRDAEIHKDTSSGKRRFYRLDDWIAKANDEMIRELGLWCADIQERSTGSRDS